MNIDYLITIRLKADSKNAIWFDEKEKEVGGKTALLKIMIDRERDREAQSKKYNPENEHHQNLMDEAREAGEEQKPEEGK